MKAIGFATEFYTLWDIQSDEMYNMNSQNQVTSSYKTVTYTYLGNLSKDLDKAQVKAKAKGATNLEPDHDLYGKNKSWKETTPKKFKVENITEFDELLIMVVSNDKEYTQEVKEAALEQMIEKDFVEMVEGTVVIKRHADKFKKWLENKKNFNVQETFLMEKNIDSNGLYHSDTIEYRFSNFKENYYNGFNYYLPIDSKGNAKRVKGRKIQITDFESNIKHDNLPYRTWFSEKLGLFFYTSDEKYFREEYIPEGYVVIKDFKVLPKK